MRPGQRLTAQEYHQRLEEGLELRTELARIDERMACLKGRIDELREDLAQRRAVELLAERATPVPAEPAASTDE